MNGWIRKKSLGTGTLLLEIYKKDNYNKQDVLSVNYPQHCSDAAIAWRTISHWLAAAARPTRQKLITPCDFHIRKKQWIGSCSSI